MPNSTVTEAVGSDAPSAFCQPQLTVPATSVSSGTPSLNGVPKISAISSAVASAQGSSSPSVDSSLSDAPSACSTTITVASSTAASGEGAEHPDRTPTLAVRPNPTTTVASREEPSMKTSPFESEQKWSDSIVAVSPLVANRKKMPTRLAAQRHRPRRSGGVETSPAKRSDHARCAERHTPQKRRREERPSEAQRPRSVRGAAHAAEAAAWRQAPWSLGESNP